MKSCEVGIIGAGIHGASVAYHLGRAGVDASVFEQWTPAAGPTGRSSAVCRAMYTNPFLARTARESIAMFENFEELTGGDAGFERTGMLYLHRACDSDGLGALVAGLSDAGVDARLVPPDLLRDAFPEIVTSEGAAAIWEETAGHADPAGTTSALIEHAARDGVVTYVRTRVVGISPQPRGGAILTTADGTRTDCRRVLIAAGPWTGRLVAQFDADLPLTVERHIVATFGWGAAPRLSYLIGDVEGGYYLKPEGRAQFGLGSLLPERNVDPDDFQEEVAPDEALALAVPAITRVPGLAAAEAAGGWASLYDVSPDWQPVIGELEDGIFVSAGTSGHGFKLAPALGRQISALLTGAEHDPALDEFSPRRFANGVELTAGFGAARILG